MMALTYNSHLEELIASEGEKALAYQWLHDYSEKRYSQLNTCIVLPVIVLSTMSGTASIGQRELFGDNPVSAVIIGLVSILVGILNTISSYFGWAKRAEGHRICAITYSKLHRYISIELSLPREQRVPAKHFLKAVREQIDRLNETAPQIPEIAVSTFHKRFKDIPADVAVPEVCNGLHKIDVYPVTQLQERLSMFSVISDMNKSRSDTADSNNDSESAATPATLPG
jgi:hypothetical protein